jgi:hypothetical protein
MSDKHKRRVLFIGEASFLATGFSTYWNGVINRLYATNEFEIAEFGSYAYDNDPRNQSVPWKFYPCIPDPKNKQAMTMYNSRPTNQFGEWRINDVLLDFKPDIVCGLRDWWMDEFILRNVFRKNFKFIWMPTIDGIPQRYLWIDSYQQTDKILTYSEWGYNVLKDEGYGKIPLVTVASPGADLDIFKPIPDKKEHKSRSGIIPDSFIIGTVMRNQKRKLYYDLIEAFSQWVCHSTKKGHTEQVKKTFLYLHTSYPDVGFDIAKAMREFKVSNHILMTYICSKCNAVYPSLFRGEWTHCLKCKQLGAHPPSASHSVPREALAQIINLFDLYVQYSICLHPDTPVLISNYNHKPIKDIIAGDIVKCGDGINRSVKWCKKTKNKSNTVELNIYGNTEKMICTSDHPIMFMDNDNNISFKNADQLSKKDWLVYPINRSVYPSDYTADFLYTIGMYAANGGKNSPGSFSISIDSRKHKRVSLCEKWMNHNNITNSRCNHNKAKEFRVIASSTEWTNRFVSLCGNGAKNKHLPHDIMFIAPYLQKYIIRGLFSGDGCVSNRTHHNKGIVFVYSSVSKQLAYQVRELLLRQNIPCSIQIQYRKNKLPKYDIRTNDPAMYDILEYTKPPDISKYKPRYIKIINDYLIMRVKNIQKSSYKGPVWDLSIETNLNEKGGSQNPHSFVTTCFVAHNCEG